MKNDKRSDLLETIAESAKDKIITETDAAETKELLQNIENDLI